jgi:hypothetical protein
MAGAGNVIYFSVPGCFSPDAVCARSITCPCSERPRLSDDKLFLENVFSADLTDTLEKLHQSSAAIMSRFR